MNEIKKLRKKLRKTEIKLKKSYKKNKPMLKKIRRRGIGIRKNINDYWEMNAKSLRDLSKGRAF